MKFTSVTALVLGCAALASAAPIHVVVVSKSVDGVVPKFRLGLAAAHGDKAAFVKKEDIIGRPHHAFHMSAMVPEGATTPPFAAPGVHSKQPCQGKSIRVSNWFRQMFGLPPIAGAPKHPHGHSHHPIKFHAEVVATQQNEHGDRPHNYHHRRPGHHMGEHLRHAHRRPFSHRLQMALMTLGPWEGRIVAFVLGCGIGVLLRLVWVLCVIAFRGLRRETEEDIDFDADEEEEYLLPPPEFTDEKVALAAAQVAVPLRQA